MAEATKAKSKNEITLGTKLQSGSLLFDAITSISAGRAKARALNLAAGQTNREAASGAEDIMRQGDAIAAQALVNAGASGGTGGSTLNVLQDMERRISQSARQTLINGMNDARNLQYQAKVAKKQGMFDAIGSVTRAAANLFAQTGG